MREELEFVVRLRDRRAMFFGAVTALVGTGVISALADVTTLAGKPGPAAWYLLVVMIAAAIGGLWVGLLASIVASLEYSYFYLTPAHSFATTGSNAIAFAAFLVAALLVSYLLFEAQRAATELLAKRHTLELAMQSGAMGSWEWQPATDRLSLSEEAEGLLGLGVGTFSGGAADFLALVHPDDRARAATVLERATEPGAVVDVDLRLLGTDGVAQWLELRGRAVGGAPHDVARVVGVVVDVTHLQEQVIALTREQGLLSAVIDQLPTGVVIAEAPSGRILLSNAQFAVLWGEPVQRADDFSDYAQFRGFHPDGRVYQQEEWPIARSVMRGESIVSERIDIEVPSGRLITIDVSATPVHDGSGRVVAGIASVVDVTARIREEREQQFLAEGSAILSSSLDYGETLASVAQLAVPALADWCSVDLVSSGGAIENVAVAHVDPEKVELARRLRAEYPPDPAAATGVPAVIRTGRSELYPEITDEVLATVTVDERQLGIARDLGLRSAITAPLTAGGRTFGAITFVSAESERRYTAGDLALLEEIARRAATAVDNARLYAEQGDARDQAEEAWAQVSRLQAVTAALSEAATTTEVAEAIVREGLVAFRAHAAAVVRLGSGGTELEVLASTGFPEALLSRWSVDAANVEGPTLKAIRTRQVVAVESVEQLVSRWPHLAEAQTLTGLNATIAAPLLVGGDAMGVIHMSFREPRRFDAAAQEFLATLARQGAQALERARLYEAEGAARENAERLTNRL
ncbi:MAG: GAF domain-containing protein, partial [Gaiellaceae bacterium]